MMINDDKCWVLLPINTNHRWWCHIHHAAIRIFIDRCRLSLWEAGKNGRDVFWPMTIWQQFPKKQQHPIVFLLIYCLFLLNFFTIFPCVLDTMADELHANKRVFWVAGCSQIMFSGKPTKGTEPHRLWTAPADRISGSLSRSSSTGRRFHSRPCLGPIRSPAIPTWVPLCPVSHWLCCPTSAKGLILHIFQPRFYDSFLDLSFRAGKRHNSHKKSRHVVGKLCAKLQTAFRNGAMDTPSWISRDSFVTSPAECEKSHACRWYCAWRSQSVPTRCSHRDGSPRVSNRADHLSVGHPGMKLWDWPPNLGPISFRKVSVPLCRCSKTNTDF